MGFGFQFVDEFVNHFVVERDRRIHLNPLIMGADELVLEKANGIGSRVGDGDFADTMLVKRDQSGSSGEMPMTG